MREVELKPVARDKVGQIIRNGVKLQSHENDTIIFLARFGFTIDVIRPVNTPHSDNPDFLINGAIWEAKSPDGGGRSTIERNVRKAGHQADNLIFDLRRINIPPQRAKKEVIKQFVKSKRLRHLMIITKGQKLLDIKR